MFGLACCLTRLWFVQLLAAEECCWSPFWSLGSGCFEKWIAHHHPRSLGDLCRRQSRGCLVHACAPSAPRGQIELVESLLAEGIAWVDLLWNRCSDLRCRGHHLLVSSSSRELLELDHLEHGDHVDSRIFPEAADHAPDFDNSSTFLKAICSRYTDSASAYFFDLYLCQSFCRLPHHRRSCWPQECHWRRRAYSLVDYCCFGLLLLLVRFILRLWYPCCPCSAHSERSCSTLRRSHCYWRLKGSFDSWCRPWSCSTLSHFVYAREIREKTSWHRRN